MDLTFLLEAARHAIPVLEPVVRTYTPRALFPGDTDEQAKWLIDVAVAYLTRAPLPALATEAVDACLGAHLPRDLIVKITHMAARDIEEDIKTAFVTSDCCYPGICYLRMPETTGRDQDTLSRVVRCLNPLLGWHGEAVVDRVSRTEYCINVYFEWFRVVRGVVSIHHRHYA